MTDTGIMNDPAAIERAIEDAHVSTHQLLGKGIDAIELPDLERASYDFHQLSTLLDLHIQDRSSAARPQEEANDHEHNAGAAGADTALAESISGDQESVDGTGGTPLR